MPAMASAESLAARRAKTGEMRPAACPLSRQVRSFVVTRIRGLKRAWSSLSDSHDTSSKRALWTIARAFRSALLIQPLSHSPKRVEYEETRASSRRDEDDESGDGQGDLRDGVASVVVPVVLVPVLLARDVLCARRGLSQEGGRVTRLLRLVQSPSEEQVAGLLRLCRSRKVFKSRMSAVSGVDDGTLQSPTTRDPGANPPRTLERASPERLPRSTTRLCRARFASLVDRFFKTQYNRFLKLSQIARNNEPRRDTLLNCATSSASCASLSARAMASSLATPSPVSTHSSAVSCCGVSPVRGRGLKKKKPHNKRPRYLCSHLGPSRRPGRARPSGRRLECSTPRSRRGHPRRLPPPKTCHEFAFPSPRLRYTFPVRLGRSMVETTRKGPFVILEHAR